MLWWTVRKLRSREKASRISAARDLRSRPDARAMEALLAALDDGSEEVRQAAATALVALGPERPVAPLGAKLREKANVEAAEALFELGPAGRRHLEAVMKDARAQVRKAVLYAAENHAALDLHDLASAALDDPEESVRRGAKDVLVKIGLRAPKSDRLPPLVACLLACESSWTALARPTQNVRLRPAINELLGGIPAEWWQSEDARRAVPCITQSLASPAAWDRTAAAEALGRIGDPRAREPLFQSLFVRPWEDEAEKRWAESGAYATTAEALSKIDPAWRTSPEARAKLEELITQLLEGRFGLWRHARYALPEIDPDWATSEPARRLLPRMIEVLAGGESYRQKSVAEALGAMGDARAVEPLKAATSDSDREVREAARRALARILPAEEVPSQGPPEPQLSESHWIPIYAEEILKFLRKEETKQYENRTGDWWTRDNLQLVLVKAGLMTDARLDFVPLASLTIDSLLERGLIRTNGTGYRSA